MDAKKRERLLIFATSAVLLLLLLDYAVIEPLSTAWKARSKRIVELRQQIAQGKQLLKSSDFIQRQWSRMETNSLPGTPSQAEARMLRLLGTWEKSANFTSASVKPQWRSSDETYCTVECTVEYVADMDKIRRFLYEIGKSTAAVRVQGMDIVARDDSGSQLNLNLTLSGLVMYPEKTAEDQ